MPKESKYHARDAIEGIPKIQKVDDFFVSGLCVVRPAAPGRRFTRVG
jgi:hypothetical protein